MTEDEKHFLQVFRRTKKIYAFNRPVRKVTIKRTKRLLNRAGLDYKKIIAEPSDHLPGRYHVIIKK